MPKMQHHNADHEKFLTTMDIDPNGRCPFLTCPMSMATAFILSLFNNSVFFMTRPIMSGPFLQQ